MTIRLDSVEATAAAVIAALPETDARRQERLEAIEGCAAALGGVAATATEDAFGYDVSGMRNTDQFPAESAVGAAEVMVHHVLPAA